MRIAAPSRGPATRTTARAAAPRPVRTRAVPNSTEGGDAVGINVINDDIKKDEAKVVDTVKVGKSAEVATKVRMRAFCWKAWQR